LKRYDYQAAIRYLENTLSIMDSADFIPDFWPEKADFWMKLGEMNNVYVQALKSESRSDEEVRQYLSAAKIAFGKCAKIRELLYGTDHIITQAAQQRLDELDED
jgi:hypothetical protein